MSFAARILCIDDDAEIRRQLKFLFEREGWLTATEEGVEAGLRQFRAFRPHLVVIDYHMPQVNGIEGVRLLRQLDGQVQILVLTEEHSEPVAAEFVQAGADDFALKPVWPPDFLSRVRLHLRLAESRRAQVRQKDAPPGDGIGAQTMARVLDCLRGQEGYLGIPEIARRTGLAYQTTWRYLQHFLSMGWVAQRNSYGQVGRPRQEFRLVRESGEEQ